MDKHAHASGSGLPGLQALFKELFEAFKKRGVNVLLSMLLAAVVGFLALVVPLAFILTLYALLSFIGSDSLIVLQGGRVVLGFLGIVAIAFGMVFANAIMAATIIHAALHDGATPMASLKNGLKIWKSIFWVGLLSALVVWGGLIPLIVPGIIIAVLVAFAQYAAVEEGKKGFAALMRSRELVKGRWLGVFGRSLAMAIGIYLPSMLLSAIGGEESMLNAIGGLYELLIATPAMVLVSAILYRHLKAKAHHATDSEKALKVYKPLAIWGLVAPILIGGVTAYLIATLFGPELSSLQI
jgi:hypothetical protein